MIHNLKVGFKVGVAYLLKKDLELGLDFLSLVEEIELVFLFLTQDAIDKLLELLWACCNWYLINPKRLASIIDEMNDNILGNLRSWDLAFLDFLFSLHLNNQFIYFLEAEREHKKLFETILSYIYRYDDNLEAF